MPNLQHTPIVKRTDGLDKMEGHLAAGQQLGQPEKAAGRLYPEVPAPPQKGAASNKKMTDKELRDYFKRTIAEWLAEESLSESESSVCEFMEIAIPYIVESAAIFRDTDDFPPGMTEAVEAFKKVRDDFSEFREQYKKTEATTIFPAVEYYLREIQNSQKFKQT